jgi:hypothetical protein
MDDSALAQSALDALAAVIRERHDFPVSMPSHEVVSAFNDDDATTHADVLSVTDAAIGRLRDHVTASV